MPQIMPESIPTTRTRFVVGRDLRQAESATFQVPMQTSFIPDGQLTARACGDGTVVIAIEARGHVIMLGNGMHVEASDASFRIPLDVSVFRELRDRMTAVLDAIDAAAPGAEDEIEMLRRLAG